jgi:hypothetical protein
MIPLFSSLESRVNPGLPTAQRVKSSTYYSKNLANLSCNQDIVYQFAAVLAYPLATSSEYVFTLSFA